MPAKFSKSIGRTLDARPDRLDLRDREFTPSVVSLPQQWPDDATIRRLVPRYCKSGLVLDQESEGACTGFGLACVVNYLNWRAALENGSARTKHRPVSPRMLYHLARFYDEWPGEDYSGSSCRGALKAWHKHGVCSEDMWPYRDAEGRVRFVTPNEKWAEDALQRRLGVYYRVNRASVVDMQAAILEIGAIYVSGDVHDGWGIAVRNKPINGHAALPAVKPMKKADSLGGHAFALVGFNRIGFVVQNSWGLRWGNCGFGVLPYEDWVKYGTDAWIAALGVSSQAAKPSNVPVRSKEKTVIARAGAITFTSSAASAPPPKVRKEVTPWSAEEAYRHTLVMGNDGEVINRIVTHENGASCVTDLVCESPLRFWQNSSKPQRIAIYAHGGLNSEDASVQRIQTLAPYFKANGVYPLFLTWRTGPTETLSSILEDELKKVPRPEGDVGDLFERVKETAAEVLDRTVEVLARPAAKPIWSQMKQNAASAADVSRGCALLADALVQLQQRAPQLEIHLVGHSAGSIILGHLLDLLPSRSLNVASCHLYAPACTVRFALDHYAPAIDNDVLPRKRFFIHLLSDDNEICDTVGPYRKSLLYLVSRALESCHKMPILGLQQAFEAKANPKWHDGELDSVKRWQKFWSAGGNGLDVVSDKQVSTGSLGPRIRACHGSFDNDATTIETTLRRITGDKLAFGVEWIDY
ncbi:MAG TPA: C1 family peptidase [Steroidobacteraceae bacterium]|nr:C1 family peptidase [Steroidobacteraceae bacterium]